ncbi:hypothetical protein [Glutamicibacter sp. NPDC087344]
MQILDLEPAAVFTRGLFDGVFAPVFAPIGFLSIKHLPATDLKVIL